MPVARNINSAAKDAEPNASNMTVNGAKREAVMPNYDYFAEAVADIDAPVETVFDFLNDQSNLSSHMGERSWMMMGSTMDIYMDEQRTLSIGSRFGFTGRLLGVPLRVDEIVTGREPPTRKTWETTAEPTLWVTGRYEMGLELTDRGGLARLRVLIRYDLPVGCKRAAEAVQGW